MGGWPDLRGPDGDRHAAGARARSRWPTSARWITPWRRAKASPKPSSSIPRRSTACPWGAGSCSTARADCGRAGLPSRHPSRSRRGSCRSMIGPGRGSRAEWLTCRAGRGSGWSIVGAGHVGQAVASLAAQADFDVWVVDDRQQYANSERFPSAQRILVGPIEEVLTSMQVTPRTYALIVTRGHGHDQEALYRLAPTAASYVGLIGSRRKIRLIFEGLRDQGIAEADLATGGGTGRPGYRLADGHRDRDQHRGRADRPAQPGSARRSRRVRMASSPRRPTTRSARAPATRGRHDRRRGTRRGPERPDGTAETADEVPGARRSSIAS